MIIPKLTPAELYEELYLNLLGLCGDILILDCILSLPEHEKSSDPLEAQAVRTELKKRLADIIDQHAKDTASIAETLLFSAGYL